ncbi:peroxiredoxin-like family protein [Kiritimatiellota bacterium B12222]|nr:peroxiredoxin-like family protein [Kiritimatiellota bacterium B12222]
MNTLREQTDAQIEKTRQAKPELMRGIDEIMERAGQIEQGRDARTVGEQAPDFELPDTRGLKVSLSELLRAGPVVVTFYRGGWCPYCNLQLRALQGRLEELQGWGAQLVAISPEVPDGSLTKAEREALGFIVLSDQDARVAARYGVAWEVPETILAHMRTDRNLDLADINNGNGSVLPIPATFVISGAGEVVWRYVDVDYRKRAEPSEVIAAVAALVESA